MQIQLDTPKAQFGCSPSESLGIGQTSICDSTGTSIPGIIVLEGQKLNDIPWYANLIVLVGIIVIARCLAYLSLRKNSRRGKK